MAYRVGLLTALPENGCAGFRAGHVVHGVLHDQAAVGASDGQGTTGAALSNHQTDDGYSEAKHLPQVHGNCLSLQGISA